MGDRGLPATAARGFSGRPANLFAGERRQTPDSKTRSGDWTVTAVKLEAACVGQCEGSPGQLGAVSDQGLAGVGHAVQIPFVEPKRRWLSSWRRRSFRIPSQYALFSESEIRGASLALDAQGVGRPKFSSTSRQTVQKVERDVAWCALHTGQCLPADVIANSDGEAGRIADMSAEGRPGRAARSSRFLSPSRGTSQRSRAVARIGVGSGCRVPTGA